jgi:hypothetical protein
MWGKSNFGGMGCIVRKLIIVIGEKIGVLIKRVDELIKENDKGEEIFKL